MRDRLFRKGLVIGIIVLFIGMAYSPNIIAVDLSKQLSVELSSNTTSSGSKTSNKGYDIAVLDIVPYRYYPTPHPFGILVFTAQVTNVGDVTITGEINYDAVAINLRNNKVEETAWAMCVGLPIGASWIPRYGCGLEFNSIYFPTYYSLQFTATPLDSNPEDNYLEKTYLIWGGFLGPVQYKLVKKTRTINKAYINTPFQWLLQKYPNLFIILQKLLLQRLPGLQ